VRRCLVKGSVLRSVACLPTHPVLSITPSQRIYIVIHRDSRIYMGIYMCGDIWEYVCVEERVSEAPPAVVRRICRYAELYVWWRLYAWWRERGKVRQRGRGGGGERERETILRDFVSKPLDKHKTTRQAQHTNRSTLETRRYDSSIPDDPSEKIIGVGWMIQT
jgi:hypothetical protein